ncbi:MAG: YaiO family outer membrane beta-barrel protein [Woeseiaceae bacterium]|nr:YaiO family outer membrane beta-barrel protein [Woeseiaceae bacterium]
MNVLRLAFLVLCLQAPLAWLPGPAAAREPQPGETSPSTRHSPESDPAAQFARAQQLLRDDEPAAALQDFSALAARYPENVDYALGQAQALARLGRTRDANEELVRGIALAPDYEALWRIRFSLVAAHPQIFDNDELETLRDDARQRFPSATWWQRTNSTSDYRGQVMLAASVESLSNNQPDWSNQSLRIDWKATDSLQVFASVGRSERFNEPDTSVSAGGRVEFLDLWHAGLELDYTNSARFLPDSSYTAYAGRRFDHGWVGEVRAQRRNYDTATVTIWSARTERYFSDYRAAYTLYVSRLHGLANAVSHAFTLDWYRTADFSAGVTVAFGDENEAIGPGLVLESSVASITINGRYALNRRFGLNGWIGVHEQGDFYRRQYAALAVTAGF